MVKVLNKNASPRNFDENSTKHKRRRIGSSIQSYFAPRNSEDPLAPRLCSKSPSSTLSPIQNTGLKKQKFQNSNSQKSIQKNKVPSSKTAPSNKKQQLYLDFGQKSFGKRTLCPLCNMLYVNGVDEDEKQHNKICEDYKNGVAYPRWKNERHIHDHANGEKVIEVRSTDPSRHLKLVRHLKTIIDQEMSFTPPSRPPNLTYYLYISCKKKVVGFLSAHPLLKAFPLTNDSSMRSTISQNVAMGVYQVWTHASSRRTGVAKRLLDAAREKIIYGMMVTRTQIAFSSPTGEGMKFAKEYIGKDNQVLVYDC